MGGLIMKPFNLNEYLANPKKKIVTRDGRSVKIYCTNYHPPQPIIAEVEGCDYATSFSSDGKYYRNRDSTDDLFFAPENREGYVNIFANPDGSNSLWDSRIYKSKEDAEDAGKGLAMYKSSVKIEWEE